MNLNQLSRTQHYSISAELIDDIPIEIFNNKNIIEPFVGDGDLLKLLNLNSSNLKTYDIINKSQNNFSNFTQMDTLLNNVLESDKYVITNPPYLAKNKLSKELKERYSHLMNNEINDLYQIFINQMIEKLVKGGLIIIPINFLIGKESEKIRNKFMNIYNIIHINIFEKRMFEYTTQNVIALLFINKDNKDLDLNEINQNQNTQLNPNINSVKINLYLPNQTIKNINPQILNMAIQNYFKDKIINNI